ncbi:MAG: hypothetical protein LBG43_07780 [Treponema sp.]|jgi:hypothetical protein|nr:hypothetical protein [Treponema sp.]
MRIKSSGILGVFSIFALLFFLNACNDVPLDAIVLFPLNSYEMNVFLAEKRQSIDSNPIVSNGDTLHPYFVHAIPQEYPDIQGIQIFLRPVDVLSVDMRLADSAIREEKLEYMFIHATDGIDGDDVSAKTAEVPPDVSGKQWSKDTPVFVSARTMELPAFALPDTLEIGRYAMIFQVIGKAGATLSSTEKAFYFLADARFAVKDVCVYLPGQPDTRMAKAGARILLEVPVVWDEPLDPYVVWSDGGRVFNAGRVSEGANRMLWKAPEIAGFKTIKAEVFPFPPFEETQEITGAGIVDYTGIVWTISIPITAKEAESEYFAERAEEFTHWYALQGDLLDRKGGAPLQPQKKTTAQWSPVAYTYGLSIGRDVYLISKPPPMETDREEESGDGDSPERFPARTDKLEFRLTLVEDGTIVRAYYDYAEESDSPASVMVSMVSKDGWLELLLNAGEEETLIKKTPLPAISPASPNAEEFDVTVSGEEETESQDVQNQNFPVVSLSVTVEENQLCADISFEENAEVYTEPVALAAPLSGSATFYLGSGDEGVVAVISELGALFNLPATSRKRQAVVATVETPAPLEAIAPPPPPD